MLEWFAYAVATALGLFATITLGKSVHHQWTKRGTTRGLLVNTFLSLMSGFAALAALYLATILQRL